MRSSEIRAQIRYHEQLLEESRAAERQAQDKVESLAAYNREHAVVTRRMEADLSARRGRLTTADIDVNQVGGPVHRGHDSLPGSGVCPVVSTL